MLQMQWLNSLAPYSMLPLRIVLGVVFFVHGAQKLFGWFGGNGFAQTAEGFGNMLGASIFPGWLLAALGGGGEFFGAILVFLGLFTRFGAFLIACTMLVAVFAVHWSGGLLASNNGFEYPLTLLAAAVTLMMMGPQRLALDNHIRLKLKKGSANA
jgi:putative oxidoreductase